MALKFIDLQNLSTFLSNLRTWIAGSDSNLVHRTGDETISGTKTFSSTIDGNAATATKLATARTITLGTDLTGSVSFDGSSNVTLNASVNDDSHNHVISNVDGLQSALDAKLDDVPITNAEVDAVFA